MSRSVGTLLGLVVALASWPAQGQGVDARLYEPATAPNGIVGVHTARPVGHLRWYALVGLDYGNDLVVGRSGAGDTVRAIEHRTTLSPGLVVGLTEWVDVGVALPAYLRQRGNATVGGVRPSTSGVGDLRVTARLRLPVGDGDALGVALVPEATVPTGDAHRLMGEDGATFAPRLVLDWRTPAGVVAALNVGYRLREAATLLDLAVGNEVLVGAGVEAPLPVSGVSVLGEARAAIGVGGDVSERTSPVDVLGGLRWRGEHGFTFTLGAGAGLTGGYGAADQRVLLSFGFGPGTEAWRPADSGHSAPVARMWEPPPPATGRGGEAPAGRAAGDERSPPAPSDGAARTRALPPEAFDAVVAADPDPDGDGLAGDRDRCPASAEDADGWEDDDGCPDPDDDHDGILDAEDRCPRQAEVINGVDDDDGCPDEGKRSVALVAGRVDISEKVFFDTGSDKIQARSHRLLKQVAQLLRASPGVRVRVEGHTDDQGDVEKNVDLSERRARRVMEFLIRRGVEGDRLEARGFGPTKPIGPNDTADGRAANRRVAFTVLDAAGGESGS